MESHVTTGRPVFLLADLTEQQTHNALVGSLILIVILMLLFGGVVLYRKWMTADDTTTGEGFTLSDLRRLHKEGKMTTAEFESAKAILIGSLKKQAEKPVLGERSGPRTSPPGTDVLPPDE
jgi:hypothetical protein